MQRFTVIGLGNFGAYLATRLFQMGHEVIAIDKREDVIDQFGARVSRAVVADATNVPVLRELGVKDSAAAIISTGSDLAASVLTLLALHDLGLEEIYVKVHSEEHRRVVEALGAAEGVFPERQAAQALASRLTSSKLLRYVELGDEFGLQEMAVPEEWQGKSLDQLSLPTTHHVQVVAIHDVLRDAIEIPAAKRKLLPSDTLLVAGAPRALAAMTRLP